ncbi:MAG: NUDIX domain-containing protein [Chloroflexota bacterium]
MERKRKVAAFILRASAEGTAQLLFHSFGDQPSLPVRLPGGGVDENEAVEDALFRELKEETGLTNLKIARKLGVQRYYKEYINADVERHDYLLVSADTLPDSWTHQVDGEGMDNGENFEFQWLTSKEKILAIDPEHGQYLTPDYIPEFFPII